MLSPRGQRGLRPSGLSNFDHHLPKTLQLAEIVSLFDPIASSLRHAVAKPDPALFQLALDALDSTAAGSVYVGNDPQLAPAAAAWALGMHAIDAARLTSLAELPAQLATLTARS
jgi:FMN phosphatase YigB (HAD superfamily)